MSRRNAAIFHLTTTKSTMQASARICRYIGEQLKLPIYDDLAAVEAVPKRLDAAILVNSPTGFADEDWRWFVAERCAKAKRFVFVQNDYKLAPPSQVRRWEERLHRRTSRIMWTTVPDRMVAQDPRSTYVNWNALTWQPERRFIPWHRRHPGLLYYGALRPHRIAELRRYFQTNKKYQVYVSAPQRSHDQLRNLLGRGAVLLPPFHNLHKSLQYFQATVYVEDPWSHEHYCSPANRFYETLSAGTAMFFDINTVYSLAQAKFNATPWIVRNPDEVQALLKDARAVAHKQWMLWHRNGVYHTELKAQLTQAWKRLWR